MRKIKAFLLNDAVCLSRVSEAYRKNIITIHFINGSLISFEEFNELMFKNDIILLDTIEL